MSENYTGVFVLCVWGEGGVPDLNIYILCLVQV